MAIKSARTGVNSAKRRQQEEASANRVWFGVLGALLVLLLLAVILGSESDVPVEAPAPAVSTQVTPEAIRSYFDGRATARKLEAIERQVRGE